MKKTFLLLLVGLMGMSSLTAQDSDSTIVYNNLISKEIHREGGATTKRWNFNFMTIETTSPSGGRYSKYSHWGHTSNFGPDNLYLGFSEMAATDGFKIKPGSSWEWGFSLCSFKTWHPSKRFGFKSALYLSRSSYRIKGDDAFHTDAEGYTVCDDALRQGEHPLNYSRQRLIHWSWRLPVEMYVKTKGGMHYSAGIEGELRHHVRSRARVGHDKKYYINRNTLDVNDFGYNALFGVGTNQFTVFARYNISDFFGSKSRVDAQPFFIGINFSDF